MSDSAAQPPDAPSAPFQFTLRQMMWGVTLFSVFCGLAMSCVKLVQHARETARGMSCQNNLKQVGLALHNYHELHLCLPSAYLCGKNGKPAHSWRWLIGPYMESNPLWFQYDFSEPWNGPKNSRLAVPLSVFQCPSAHNESPLVTNYVAVVGPDTMWPGREPAKLAEDGSDNDKVLVIEIANSDIHWMEPRDLTLEEALDAIQPEKGVGIGSAHPDGIHYVTVGGEVRVLDRNIDRESLRKLLTRDKPLGRMPETGGADK